VFEAHPFVASATIAVVPELNPVQIPNTMVATPLERGWVVDHCVGSGTTKHWQVHPVAPPAGTNMGTCRVYTPQKAVAKTDCHALRMSKLFEMLQNAWTYQ
jgi:hypothetical protein